MSEPLVLGLDGGGSKTLMALAARDGRVTRVLTSDGINPLDAAHWREPLDAMFERLRVELRKLDGAALGMPGYGEVPHVSAAQAAAVGSRLGCPHSLHNDVEMAFDGAFLGQPGVLILAGTGSMAWAQAQGSGPHEGGAHSGGPPIRVGGWGSAIGDEGSAFWIGREAIARTTRALDGRLAAPEFAEAMLAAMRLPATEAPAALLGWYHSRPHIRSAVAALATTVDALAAGGDVTARSVMLQAAHHLSDHVEAARRRIGQPDAAWSYAGGVFASAVVCDSMAMRLGTAPRPAILPPIGGALWRAACQAGWSVDAAWVARLAASLAASVPERLNVIDRETESRHLV